MGNFFIKWWESGKKWFWLLEPLSNLKTTFCKYWTLIKIKSSITCLYKGYKVKMKMAQEEWLQLKIKILYGYNIKLLFKGANKLLMWGNKNLVGTIYSGAAKTRFLACLGGSHFQLVGGLPHSLAGKTLIFSPNPI